MQSLDVAFGCFCQLLAEVLQADAITGEDGVVTTGNADDIEFEPQFAHQLLLLQVYLL